jgi:amino acid transporter
VTATLLSSGVPDHTLELTDLGVHRLRGFAEPERLWQVGTPDLPGQFPPVHGERPVAVGLPTHRSSLVGRDDDERRIRAVLEHHRVVTLTGVAFIAVMTWISYRGTEIGEKLQNVLLGIQYLALVIFVVAAIVAVTSGNAPEGATLPDASWFNPFAFDSSQGFIEAILLALFIYWGWDTCLALNEETKDPEKTPGRAAILSTIILLITYVGVTVAAMAYAGLGEAGVGLANENNADDVFFALKDLLFGPFAWLLVVAVVHD